MKYNKREPLDLKSFQYKRMLEEKKGHNYQYYSEKLEKYMIEKNYFFYPENGFNVVGHPYVTTNEEKAKIKVNILRKKGYYARIICGYEQNQQRIKCFSIIVKKK